VSMRLLCWRCGGRGFIEYIGDDLREKRKHAGKSLRWVARQLILSPSFICDIELNRRGCTERIRRFYDEL